MDFLPEWPMLLAFAVAVAVVAVTPGPDMTLFLSKTLAHGRRAGMVTFLGAASGLMVHTLFAAVGLTAVLAASATAFTVLKVAGAAYLMWLAVNALRNGSAFRIVAGGGRPASLRRLYLMGLGINILNPKIILFFVTFLPQFVSPSDPAAMERLLFLGLFFVIGSIPICFGLIVVADRIAAALRTSPRLTRVIDYIFASIFGGFAVALLFERGRA